jgi:hypothetical protein
MIQGLTRLGDLAKAWDWSNRVAGGAPKARPAKSFWTVRSHLARRLGIASEASEADRIVAGLADAR